MVRALSVSAAMMMLGLVGCARPPASGRMTLDLGGGVRMTLVPIPAGTFQMGSPVGEPFREKAETLHTVTISRPFHMGATAVTQQQYEAVTGANPSRLKGERNPVENVSWNEATTFCRKLSERTGKPIRLPTEAEWEYACRAGTTTAYNFGDRIDATKCNFADRNSASEWADKTADDGFANTAPVAGFPPNAWGLYDMHGNIWEWCRDWRGDYPAVAVTDPTGPASGRLRVLRGGSWNYKPTQCRSAYRHGGTPSHGAYRGLRVVCPAAGGR